MISERIKDIRTQNKMSQTDLANKIGITRSSVNAWEMGVSVPSVQYLLELVKIFKITSDYLLGLDDTVTINIGHLDLDARKFMLDLIKLLENYTEAMNLLHENNLYIADDPALQPVIEPTQKKHLKQKDQP